MSGYPSDPGNADQGPRSYGSMPPPGPAETRGAVTEPPQDVRRASMVLYITAAWSVLGLVLAFAMRGSTEDAIRDADPTASEDVISAALTLGLVIGAVIGLGFALLYYLCGKKMLEGRNWARIVPTVLIGIGLLFGAVGIGSGSYTAGTLVSLVIGVVLGVAFLVFAWRRPANDYFAAAKGPR